MNTKMSFCQRPVPCYGPESDVRSLVILLHGYGADGDNLLSLGHMWAPHLPHTVFLAPHAIEAMGRGGYQWFELSHGAPSDWTDHLERAAEKVVTFLWDAAAHYHVSHDRVALVGFSQGGMLALHIGLFLLSLGCVVSYSGLLVPTKRTPCFFPPLLLTHGDKDEVLPVEVFQETCRSLDHAHIRYTSMLLKGVSHTIPPEASAKGREFVAEHLVHTTPAF